MTRDKVICGREIDPGGRPMSTPRYKRNVVSLADAPRVVRYLDAVDPAPGKPRHINQLCADLAPAILVEMECGASQASVARRIAAITGLKEFTCSSAVKAALAGLQAPTGYAKTSTTNQHIGA
jgi:hypothetical protein